MADTANHAAAAAVAIVIGFIGLAIVAVFVSSKSSTPGLLTTSGTSLANVIKCALSPVIGGTCGGLVPNVTSTVNFGNPL